VGLFAWQSIQLGVHLQESMTATVFLMVCRYAYTATFYRCLELLPLAATVSVCNGALASNIEVC